MKRIVKPSAMDLVALALREEIAAGRWDDRLPGARVLAQHLGASPPTVAAALTKLVTAGILEGGGQRRAFRVVGTRNPTPKVVTRTTPQRLLILTPEELGQLTELSRELLEKLRDQMAQKGWRVDYQVVDFLHVKHVQHSWDRKIQVDPRTSVIALYGRPPLAEWALRRNIRMLFLGGATDGLPMPMVGVKSSLMAESILAKLTALGHWRIVIPLCDRAESFKLSMREATRRVIEATGQTYIQAYHNPESDYMKPDVTWRILESAFAKNPPSALIFLDWRELVTAQCLLARMGLQIPEDVSVVLLNDQSEAEWFFPQLARFRFPVRRLLKIMTQWLEDDDGNTQPRILHPEFIEGATIAPVRRPG